MTNPNVLVSAPSQLFTLPNSFAAIAGGSIYIGQVDTDPTIAANQIQVYVQNSDGSTTAVMQPINIGTGGYPEYNGMVATFVTVEEQSMAILDANGVQQFYYPNVMTYIPDPLSSRLASSTGYSLIGSYEGNLDNNINFVTPQMFINSGQFATVSLAIQAMLDYASTSNKKVLAWGSTITLNSSISMLNVEWYGGQISGASSVLIKMSGASAFYKTIIAGPVLKPIYGDLIFDGCEVKNCTATAALAIDHLTAESTIDVVRCDFHNCNYAILQQGPSSSFVTRFRIMDCSFTDLNGDGIEMNVVNGHYSDGLLIEDILLNNINNTNGQPFWGIGIGIAGQGPYALNQADTDFAQNVTIRRVRATNCKQPIHFEVSKNFSVIDCDLTVDSTASIGTGLESVGVVTYGCTDFIIDNIRGEPDIEGARFIHIAWGVSYGAYMAPCREFTVKNIYTRTGMIDIATSSTDTTPNQFSLESSSANIIRHRGLGSKMKFSNLRCAAFDGIGAYSSGEGEGGGIYQRNANVECEVVDVIAIDDNGAKNGSFTKLYTDLLITLGCNFDIVQTTLASGQRGYLLGNVGNQYFLTGNDFPPGREFSKNDILFKAEGGKFVITSSGCFIQTGDTLRTATAGQTYIESSGAKNWGSVTGAPKTAGTQIIISGGGLDGADIAVTITRSPYAVGGIYRINISPGLGADIPAGTMIAAKSPVSYVDIS